MAATLTASSSGELLVHQYGAGNFTINSGLVSTAGLTKTGPSMLILGGNNTGLTGPININRGGITATTTAAVNSASRISFNDDRTATAPGTGLQTFTVDLGSGVSGTIAPPIRLTAFNMNDYGTYFSTGSSSGSTITLSGVLSSTPGLTATVRFTGPAGNTTGFNLTNTNTFAGNVSLAAGTLGITSGASLGIVTNTLALDVGDAANGGLVFLNGGANVLQPIDVNAPTRFVCDGTNTNTISGVIAGPGTLVKAGTGTLTISNAGNSLTGGVTVAAGTLSLGTTGGLPAGTNMTVSGGGTVPPARPPVRSTSGR